MKFFLLFLTFLALLDTSIAKLNGHCHNKRVPGTCVKKSSCRASRGYYNEGNCPGDPADVICCSKKSCGTGGDGNCRWKSSCSGSTVGNQCPGPASFKCCEKHNTFRTPSIPTSKCKSHVESAGKKILDKFPGRVKTVYCYADKPNSDHNKGLALDFMVGDYNPAGWEIAEWARNNYSSLKITYIIWGMKIWLDENTQDKKWDEWGYYRLGEGKDLSAQHWDHVHISFKAQ